MQAIAKPYTIDGFDYSGEADTNYYEEALAGYLNRFRTSESNAIAGANWDLQTLSRRYQMNPSPEMAAIVRAQWLVVNDLLEGAW